MAVKIRLKRLGRKKRAFYRLVVMESANQRDGETIEIVGHYDPAKEPLYFDFDEDRVKYWLSVGAQPSDTAKRLLGEKGVLPKEAKVPKEPGVSKKEKKLKAEKNQ